MKSVKPYFISVGAAVRAVVVLLVAMFVIGCASVVPKEGLVAYYEFNNDAKDSSGLGNNGRFSQTEMVADRNGNEKSACRFNGKSSMVQVSPHDTLDEVRDAVTIAAWIKPASWDPWFYMPIVCKGSSTRFYGLMLMGKGNSWLKGKDSSTCFELCRLKPGVNVFVRTYSDAKIEIGEWQHVAISYENGIVRAYLNGELVGKAEAGGPLLSGKSPLYIGCDPEGGLEFFNGDMDDLRIYNRRLTSKEVEGLYDGELNWFSNSVRAMKWCFCPPAE